MSGPPRPKPHRNLRLLVEYEGTRYRGWQFQPRERTVMGELHNAVQEAFQEQPVILGAGRTDAGVHADGQVANFYTATTLPVSKVADELNARLPHDIAILDVSDVPMSFHARHSAVSRTYRYQIATRKTAFFKTTVWWVRDRLDAARMGSAASLLAGQHDFGAFGDVPPGEDPRVRMLEATVRPHEFLVLVHLRAERFLWKMARRIVGVLVEIGAGRLPESAIRDFLARPTRSAASLTAPPSGLFLQSVEYPAPGETARPPRRGARARGRLSGRAPSRRIPGAGKRPRRSNG